MADNFRYIGLIGKHGDPCINDTILKLGNYLMQRNHEVLLEESTSECMEHHRLPLASMSQIADSCDLVIVVGGDGTMLLAARAMAPHSVPLLGINLGRIGYLADISPDAMIDSLEQIFAGNYETEQRLLLRTDTSAGSLDGHLALALNDVVIHKWNISRMIEFETYIDGRYVGTQRSDGLIVSTPTGSTAYALSGGGPLLHPALDAMVLVPICPHTLNTRPIVVGGDSQVDILLCAEHHEHVRITCDGQLNLPIQRGEQIHIRKYERTARLIHPRGHNHFDIMRRKLGWGEHPSR